MVQPLKSLEKIDKINKSFPMSEPVKEWKRKGGKVVGWTCINMPEEILHAAGILPMRITGNDEELSLTRADACMYSNTCSFVKSSLELKLRGEFDFLDGYIGTSSCEGAIRLAEVGPYFHKIPLIYILDVPRKIADRSLGFYHAEMLALKLKIEEKFNVRITEEALINSMDIYNKTRNLFRSLHELRKQKHPPVSGTEMLQLYNASIRIPREDFNDILEDVFSEIEGSGRAFQSDIRLMLSGAVLNNVSFLKGIEELNGVTVVTDDLCTGSRYWWENVITGKNGDPWKDISDRYMNTVCPCPRLNPPSVRLQWIKDEARELNVSGIIALTMRNCAPFIHDLPLWKGKLEDNDVPVLDLDIEYGGPFSGQVRTRIEAFLETLSWGLD